MMTPRERLCAAMRRQEVDKVPCSPRWGHGGRILYPGDPAPAFDLMMRAAEEFGFDPHVNVTSGVPNLLKEMDADARGVEGVRIEAEVADDGPCEIITRTLHTPAGVLREKLRMPKPGRLEYGLGPNPVHLERMVKGPEDLPALRCLMPNPAQYDVCRQWREMDARLGERGVAGVVIWSPLDYQAGYAYAMEDMMVDYFERREFVDELLGIFQDKMMTETEAVLKSGAKVVFGTWFFASLSVGWSPAMFRELFLPQLKAHVELVHRFGAVYDYYDDGKVMGVADMVAEAGVDVFETLTPPPVGDADLVALKRRIGGRVCLKGYGDLLYGLKMGTPQSVEKMVREAMETAGPGGGFIYGTSDGIREGTPRENLETYLRAAAKYGKQHAR